MLINNNQRLNIWIEDTNRTFDYEVMYQACLAKGVMPLGLLEFAQKVGMITVGAASFPELESTIAYKMVAERNAESWARRDIDLGKLGLDPAASCCGGAAPGNKSRGLGDTVYKITHATGLDKLAEMYTKITGKPCGCAERQEALNKLLPYGIKED